MLRFIEYSLKTYFAVAVPSNITKNELNEKYLVRMLFKTFCCLDQGKVKIYLKTIDLTVASNVILYKGKVCIRAKWSSGRSLSRFP